MLLLALLQQPLSLLLLLLLQHWRLVRCLHLVLMLQQVWLRCPAAAAAALLQRVLLPVKQPQLHLLSLLLLMQVQVQLCWLLLRALADCWQLLAPSALVLLARLLLLLLLLLLLFLLLVLHCQVPLLAALVEEAQGLSQGA